MIPNGLNSALEPMLEGKKAMGTFNEVKSMGTFNEVPDAGILGMGQPDPQINWSVEQLEVLRDRQQQLFGNLQKTFDLLDDARKKLAAEKMQVAQRGEISPDEAMKAFAAGMAAKFMGARDKYIQGASQQFLETRNQQLDQQYLEDTQMNQEDFRQRTAQGVAGIQSIQDDIGQYQSQIKGIEAQISDVFDQIRVETQQAGLNDRAMLEYKTKTELQQMKDDARIAIEQLKDDGAERLRFFGSAQTLLRSVKQQQLGRPLTVEEEKDVVAEAGFMALSDKYLDHAKYLGLEIDNEIAEATKDFEIELKRLGVDIKTEELDHLKKINPEKIKELQERIKNHQKSRENTQSIIEKRKNDTAAAALELSNSGKDEFEANKQKYVAAQEVVVSGINKDIAETEDRIRELRLDIAKSKTKQEQEVLEALKSEDEKRLKTLQSDKKKEEEKLKNIKNYKSNFANMGPPKKAQAPSGGADTKASTDLHTQKRNELTSRFGIRVDQHSAPRKMRGGGGTGMSRHGSGRALDVFYGNKPKEVLKALQENGAKLIIDYANQRTWRPDRTPQWRNDKGLNKSHKHYHVEYD